MKAASLQFGVTQLKQQQEKAVGASFCEERVPWQVAHLLPGLVLELACKNINTELLVCASIVSSQTVQAMTVTEKCSCTCSTAALPDERNI